MTLLTTGSSHPRDELILLEINRCNRIPSSRSQTLGETTETRFNET